MSFNFDDVLETLKIVRECKDAEIHIDTGDVKLSLFKGNVGERQRGPIPFSGNAGGESAPEAVPAAPAPEATQKQNENAAVPQGPQKEIREEGLVPIKANMTSVFYRRPSPEEGPFVEVGDIVEENTVVCLLEVMKCFRQVTADVRGRVEKVCVENSDLVEAGTVLFLIRPE